MFTHYNSWTIRKKQHNKIDHCRSPWN
uniref:Uncharacterized protein n=1 Tax=Anguilla anguilla TaxID=7936 RepID=A0A0E9TXV0_ANGAN